MKSKTCYGEVIITAPTLAELNLLLTKISIPIQSKAEKKLPNGHHQASIMIKADYDIETGYFL